MIAKGKAADSAGFSQRRQLNKGQQAMAVAFAYPEPKQGKKRTFSISEKVSEGRLSHLLILSRKKAGEEKRLKFHAPKLCSLWESPSQLDCFGL